MSAGGETGNGRRGTDGRGQAGMPADSVPLQKNLAEAMRRMDALIEQTDDLERLRTGMGIRLALGMAQELKDGVPLGSRTGELVAAWTGEHGADFVDLAVRVAREFLIKPEELRKALGQRLGLEGDSAGAEADSAAAEAESGA
jgi:hypothetical protein